MKQLTELKDGQKVLVALNVKIDQIDNDYPFDLYTKDGYIFNSLSKNLSFLENLATEEIYDFEEVMSAKKSEPIIKPEFDAIIEDYLYQLHTDCIGEKLFLKKMYELFRSYYPTQEQKNEPISKEEFEKIVKKLLKLCTSSNRTIKESEEIFINDLYNLFQSYHPESFTPEIGKEYEFSDNGINWYRYKLESYNIFDENYKTGIFFHIRPIKQSEEELKAIELLKNLGYKIEK